MLIQNARILTMEDTDYQPGDLRVVDGKIAEIAAHLLPLKGEQVYDATGYTLTPGLVDAHCHIGMWEDGICEEGDDGNEATDPVTPQLRAIDSINPRDYCFTEARQGGVTSVITGPGSANVLGGQFAALKTRPGSVEDMTILPYAAAKAALGENPKRVYKHQKKTPTTRMATAALLRQALIRGQEYAEKLEQYPAGDDKRPPRDLALEALLPVLRREIPLKIHAHRADDIQTALRIAKEFGVCLSIEHCTEGHLIVDDLKNSGATVIIGPLVTERPKVEMKNLTLRSAGILEEAGIPFAIMTDHPVLPLQYLPICAALAVREGCSETAALRAITLHAAAAVGLDHRIGSLKPGKDADLVLWAGDPLDCRTKVRSVWIDGELLYSLDAAGK